MFHLDHKNLFVIAYENGAASLGWQDPPDFHGDDIVFHEAILGRKIKKTSSQEKTPNSKNQTPKNLQTPNSKLEGPV
jgi:hypothetical protein